MKWPERPIQADDWSLRGLW